MKRLAIALAALAAAGAVAFFALRGYDGGGFAPAGASGRIAFPAPAAHPASADVAFEDFVGARTCGGCHADQYAAWRGSTHGRAGGPPGPETLIASFDGEPIRFADVVVTPSATAAGDYLFTVERDGAPPDTFRVDGVVGGGHMLGGGTQGYFTRRPDGTYRLFPLEFIRREGVWFCNTNPRTGEGWVPVTAAMELADCGDWPPVRVLGDPPRFGNCQACHGSQIQAAFDTAADRYGTRFTSLKINCESCHGPGRRHVELARSGRLDESADIGLPLLDTLGTDASLAVCFRCHALKDGLEPGYLPGESLEEHYALKFPILGDRPYHADGRVRTFAYQGTHLFSACYLDGAMTCVDCHEPHGQGYRGIRGRPLESRFADAQCTACHASKATDLERHTFHPPESAGSRCVACHMPYLQHPLLGDELRFARSDHVIPIPRPAFDASLGIETSCAQCHERRSTAELQATVDRWWGELKPHRPLVRAVIRAADVADADSAAALLLRPDRDAPIVQFQALARFVERFLRPDMPVLSPTTVDRLRRLATHDDIDVRSLALAALHLARGEEPDVRAFLADRLANADADGEAVRKRWAAALAYLGDTYRAAGRLDNTITAYRKALEVRPEDARVLLNLGVAYSDAGAPSTGIDFLRRSIALDPNRPLAYVNLGIAHARLGDEANAIAAYRRAIDVNPSEPLAHFNLGNVYLRRRQPARAAPLFERAVALDPALALGHYHLARSYLMLREYRKALDAVERALALDATIQGAARMRADLERALAGG